MTVKEIAEMVEHWRGNLADSKAKLAQIESDIYLAEREIYRWNKRYKEALEKELRRIE